MKRTALAAAAAFVDTGPIAAPGGLSQLNADAGSSATETVTITAQKRKENILQVPL